MIPPAQRELSVIQGFQALLPCAAQGSPEPRVSWEKDGVTVPSLPGKFTVLRSGELIIERAEVEPNIFTALQTLLSSFGHRNQFWLLSLYTAWRCWCVHMCGYQCSGLCETRHPPVHQHEARLQGVAYWCIPEQRAESGPVLPRSGNSTSRHLLDHQQQSLHRYYLPLYGLSAWYFNTTKVLRCHCDTKCFLMQRWVQRKQNCEGPQPPYFWVKQDRQAGYNIGIILVGKVIVGQQYLSEGQKQSP